MDFLKNVSKPKPVAKAPPPAAGLFIATAGKSSLPIAKELSDYAGLIDEVGQLQGKVQDVNAQIQELQMSLAPYGAKLKELTEKLEEHVFPDLDPGQAHAEHGHDYRLDAGPCAKMRAISDMDAVKDIMGSTLFMQVAKVQLGDLDKYLTEAQREKCITSSWGKRKLKIVKAA